MSKEIYQCQSCGYQSVSWFGKCPDCSEWETFEKMTVDTSLEKASRNVQKAEVVVLSKVKESVSGRVPTGVFEFDRVLGGGFVSGEMVLLAGEPGVGKSTILLEVLQKLKILYVSGEESASQIKGRASRLNVSTDSYYFSSNTEVEAIIEALSDESLPIELVVIDSVQMLYSQNIPGAPGGVAQIKEVLMRLIDFAKSKLIPIIVVGHITKEGAIAGPKTLEHLVDCVLYLEGEKFSPFRILRANKNRFGPTDEIGLFEMGETGLKQVENPTQFLQKDNLSTIGKSVVGVMEGSRSIFFEIQSLVVASYLPSPRRVVSGLDYNKVQLLLAVIQKYIKLPLDKFDVYVSVAGGVSTKSTACDLGVIASIISSFKSISLASKAVFIGEVSLLGEVRPVFQQKKLLKDATRYGFSPIYSHENIRQISQLQEKLK